MSRAYRPIYGSACWPSSRRASQARGVRDRAGDVDPVGAPVAGDRGRTARKQGHPPRSKLDAHDSLFSRYFSCSSSLTRSTKGTDRIVSAATS